MCGAPDQATISREGIPTGETVIQGLVYQGDSPAAGSYVRLLEAGGEFTAEVDHRRRPASSGSSPSPARGLSG